ncbi:MAG: DMT family transporter [Actinomycetota bacterium]|nr:DMT family transporter [Actinomycetota bacterium]
MDSGFVLGAGAALAWGLADVIVTYYARRIGFLRALLVIHGLSLVPLAALALVLGAPEGASSTQWAAAGALGPLAVIAYAGFYRALELGPISIVSPIVSAFGAVVVLLALLVGETLTELQALGCALVISFVVLASIETSAGPRLGGRGIRLSLLACVSFGAYLFLLGLLAEDLGWLFPILLSRIAAVVILAGIVAARQEGEAGSLGPVALLGCAATGALEASAYLLFNRGAEIGELAITGAALSAYPVIPIVVGLVAFRERVAGYQLVGVAGVLVGMVVLSLG